MNVNVVCVFLHLFYARVEIKPGGITK